MNVWANFSMLGLSKSAKVTWDFGDGHKSYLQMTRHEYAQTGTYAASVKFSEGSEDVIKNFSVKVEKIPHPNVDIVSMVANPKGSDAVGEKITLKNRTKKRINLLGWSVATSSKKKMINHPINLKFILKKKQTKTLTKQYSKFTLNNKKGKIQLRYPDGKAAYTLKYDIGDGYIADDEVYQKIVGGWGWILPKGTITETQEANNLSIKGKITNNIQNTITNISTNAESKNIAQNDNEEVPKEKILLGAKKGAQLPLSWELSSLTKIELLKTQSHIFKIQDVREENGQYYFTPQTPIEGNYMIIFLKNISVSANEKINGLLNKSF